jgi:hypothetical protein
MLWLLFRRRYRYWGQWVGGRYGGYYRQPGFFWSVVIALFTLVAIAVGLVVCALAVIFAPIIRALVTYRRRRRAFKAVPVGRFGYWSTAPPTPVKHIEPK